MLARPRPQVTLGGEALPWDLTIDVQCAAGKGALLGSGAGTCGCAAGTAPSAVGGSAACEPCAAGFHKEEAGDSPCRMCEVGSFSAEAGSPSCRACEAGTFAASLGAEQCQACAPGTISAGGAASCDPCPPGAPPTCRPTSTVVSLPQEADNLLTTIHPGTRRRNRAAAEFDGKLRGVFARHVAIGGGRDAVPTMCTAHVLGGG